MDIRVVEDPAGAALALASFGATAASAASSGSPGDDTITLEVE